MRFIVSPRVSFFNEHNFCGIAEPLTDVLLLYHINCFQRNHDDYNASIAAESETATQQLGEIIRHVRS